MIYSTSIGGARAKHLQFLPNNAQNKRTNRKVSSCLCGFLYLSLWRALQKPCCQRCQGWEELVAKSKELETERHHLLSSALATIGSFLFLVQTPRSEISKVLVSAFEKNSQLWERYFKQVKLGCAMHENCSFFNTLGSNIGQSSKPNTGDILQQSATHTLVIGYDSSYATSSAVSCAQKPGWVYSFGSPNSNIRTLMCGHV